MNKVYKGLLFFDELNKKRADIGDEVRYSKSAAVG